MRGRHGGRGRGGGRFNRRPPSNGLNASAASTKKKSLEDYTFYVGSNKQASDFEVSAEYIINHIKKTFDRGNDIAESLRELELTDTNLWRPSLQVSIDQDDEVKKREDRQFELEFKAELDESMRRRRMYESNLYKAYALLWERCAKAMQNKILARTDYESKIYNNPVELLKAIKEHALNFEETRYEMSIISDAYRALFLTRQKEGESLQDYTRRFKTARDILESHLGSAIILPKYVRAMKGYQGDDADDTDKKINQASEAFIAYVYMENADQAKYGSILRNLSSQKSLGNDQYPRTITEANNVLSTHKFDNLNSHENKNQQKNKNQPRDPTKRDGETKDEVPVLLFAQLEGKCYCCGKAGHKSPQCRHKDRPRDEWAIHKSQQSHAQANADGSPGSSLSSTTQESKTTGKGDKTIGWAGAQVFHHFFQHDEMKDWILLDSESSATIFCNPDMVTGIKGVDKLLTLHTNGGPLITTQKCNIPHFGEGWYNPASITNIFSMAEMVDKYRVTFDSKEEDALIVHLPDRKIKFKRSGNGLYYMKPSNSRRESETTDQYDYPIAANFITTLEENKKFYGPCQFEQAKKACEFYHAMGTPSIPDLKAMIRMNLIRNCPITNEDITLAEKIFGPDVGTIKGKTTRRKPLPVIDNMIEIPPELISVQEDVTLMMDGITVNGLKFLTTISKNLYYRTAQYMPRTGADDYECAITSVLSVYRRGGFRVVEIRCDNEFHAAMDRIAAMQNPPIRMNYANAQEHVPEAEQNNRTIKERARATYHRLPFKHLPRILVKYLVIESARKLNFFPATHGVSKHYSPRMILHQENLDYDRHCSHALGTYVQGHDEPNPTNTQAPRSLDCIYLRPTSNAQGGHELLHLATNAVVNRRNVTTIPITPGVIRQVHALAEQDGMPHGLKITSRTNTVLYDSAWIAGVDYNEEMFEDDDYNDENEPYSDNNDEEEANEEESEDEDVDEMDPNELADILNDPPVVYHDDADADVSHHEADDDHESNDNNVGAHNDEPEYQIDQDDANGEGNQPNSTEVQDNQDNEDAPQTTRSGREIRVPERYMHLNTNAAQVEEYSYESAQVIARVMCHLNAKLKTAEDVHNYLQTYSLQKGLKEFGSKGREAAVSEMKQLHDRAVFKPIQVDNMTATERKRAMESLIFLVEKRDGRIKARTCANGSTQRAYIDKEEAASPTASTEAILITGVIDAKQGRDVMTADIPNAFVQTEIDQSGEKVCMKIRGALVDMLVEISPETYKDYVVFEGNQKVLYVQMLMALYGMLISSLLYYKKFRKDIEDIGFIVNPYDVCVANRIVNNKQHTLTWHVDDVKSSHVDTKVNDEFADWLEFKYGDDEIGHVKVTRGKRHNYLAMNLDYSTPGVLKVDMKDYVKDMIDEFPDKLSGNAATPWTETLFKVDDNSKKLGDKRRETLHSFVMKAMFLCKRGRPDISTAVAFLTTRVKEPDERDWQKLLRLMNFLLKTKDDVLSLEANDTNELKWYIDAAFAVHKDMKSHTGTGFTLGKGMIISDSTKQKVNSRSSTESELNGIDDKIAKVIWTKRFIEAQGFKITLNIIYQDNTSTIKLGTNGKSSSGKRTRHFDIKLFYVTDLIERGEVIIHYCPTGEMVADYYTKPLVGTKFQYFRDIIMNFSGTVPQFGQQECVG